MRGTSATIRAEKKRPREPETVEENAPRRAPPRSPKFLNYVHSFIAIPLICLYTFVMGSISLILSLYDPTGKRQHWCARNWCRLIAVTAGARVRVYGAHHVKRGVSYVFLSTHQSLMDIPAMLGYLPAQLRIAAKKSLFRIPFMGWHLTRAGHIPIDRSSTQNAVASMQKAAAYLCNGICAFVFPEGTRSRDGYLHKFKKGGFKLAIQAQTPIIPIAIIGSRQILPYGEIIFRPGPMEMYIDEPIETRGLTDADIEKLMETVYERMAKHFDSE
ncbi:MAG TPA: lysophospholipid acyltransferase family protein [Pyrinomonadaceae bacterium]